ncbi:DRAP deaminase [Coemansia sp. RSA 2399]|nr:DRAP deaminase [Coemansia sp. RSA 2399]
MNAYTERDVEFMRQALSEGRKCSSVETAYNVGAVITTSDGKRVVATGYSRKYPGNTHAEQCALMDLAEESADCDGQTRGLVMYTTMEPCSKRLSGNKPCSQGIMESGIDTVFVGVMEPDHFVNCTGAKDLVDKGIKVIHIEELEAECKALNSHLVLN